MIYEIKVKDKITDELKTYSVDDEVWLQDQPKDVRGLINEYLQGEDAKFENCSVRVYQSGRFVIY